MTQILPLTGYRVVDLADEKGELAGRILADFGAEVIRVEPPKGARSRRLPPFAPSGQEPLLRLSQLEQAGPRPRPRDRGGPRRAPRSARAGRRPDRVGGARADGGARPRSEAPLREVPASRRALDLGLRADGAVSRLGRDGLDDVRDLGDAVQGGRRGSRAALFSRRDGLRHRGHHGRLRVDDGALPARADGLRPDPRSVGARGGGPADRLVLLEQLDDRREAPGGAPVAHRLGADLQDLSVQGRLRAPRHHGAAAVARDAGVARGARVSAGREVRLVPRPHGDRGRAERDGRRSVRDDDPRRGRLRGAEARDRLYARARPRRGPRERPLPLAGDLRRRRVCEGRERPDRLGLLRARPPAPGLSPSRPRARRAFREDRRRPLVRLRGRSPSTRGPRPRSRSRTSGSSTSESAASASRRAGSSPSTAPTSSRSRARSTPTSSAS